MFLDSREYPVGYTFAEVVAKALGVYVYVADFQEHRGQRMFRMILDGELDRRQLIHLLDSSFRDNQGTYKFSHIEILPGPLVDQIPHRSDTVSYLRATFT